MPKIYKQNILTSSSAPQDYATSFNDLGTPNRPQEDLSSYLIPTPIEVKPEPVIEPEKTESEPLLQSPLDTPELPPAPTEPRTNPEPSHSIDHPVPPQGVAPTPETHLVETLMTWHAPARPYRKKNRSFFITVATLIILIAMIALLAGEQMLVGVLFAFMFLVYVINFIPPVEVEFKLSTQGVTVDSHFYHWQELDSFWFEKKEGYTILHILTQLRFPSMLMLVLGTDVNSDDVKHTVARFLPFHEIAPKSIIEKWAESLSRYFPLENPNH